MAVKISIIPEALETFMRDHEITTQRELAVRIGVAESTVYRVLEGRLNPGKRFVYGFIKASGKEFEDLFLLSDVA